MNFKIGMKVKWVYRNSHDENIVRSGTVISYDNDTVVVLVNEPSNDIVFKDILTTKWRT